MLDVAGHWWARLQQQERIEQSLEGRGRVRAAARIASVKLRQRDLEALTLCQRPKSQRRHVELEVQHQLIQLQPHVLHLVEDAFDQPPEQLRLSHVQSSEQQRKAGQEA